MAARRWTTAQHLRAAPGPDPIRKPIPTQHELHRRWRLQEIKRQKLMPHLWTAGTAATGLAGWGMDALCLATIPGYEGWTVPGIVAAATAGTHLAVRWVNRKKIDPMWRRRYAAGAALSSIWATLATATGVHWTELAGLLVAEAAVGAGYWRHLRREAAELAAYQPPAAIEAAPTSAPAAKADDDTTVETYITRYTRYVGSTGVLAGSRLTNGHRTDKGAEFVVDLKPGAHTLETALGAIPSIISGLSLIPDLGQDVIIDRPRGAGLTASQVRLQIIEKSPVQTAPFFTQPILDPAKPGRVAIGLYADGDGHATWTVFDQDGMWSGVIIAGTGSGKSSLLDVLAISARATGVVNIMFVDPQGGASSPLLRDNASILALGEEQMPLALRALEDIAVNREIFLNAHGLSKIVPGEKVVCRVANCPCGGWAPPGLLVIIDECDQVFDGVIRVGENGEKTEKVADRWGRLAKRVRKLGVAFAVASQYSGQKVFGGSELLRLNLAARNNVALPTKSKSSGALIPGLPVDPTTLPPIPGYGVIDSAESRTAPFRAFWAVRADDPKARGVNPPVFADDLVRQLPEPTLHPVDKSAVKGRFPDPEQAAQQARTVALNRLAALMGDHAPMALETPAPPVPPVASAGQGSSHGGTYGGMPKIPTGLTPELLHQPGSSTDESEVSTIAIENLGERTQMVLLAVAEGHIRTRDIVAACGPDNPTTRRWVQAALRDLEDVGLVLDAGHGRWELTADAEDAVQEFLAVA